MQTPDGKTDQHSHSPVNLQLEMQNYQQEQHSSGRLRVIGNDPSSYDMMMPPNELDYNSTSDQNLIFSSKTAVQTQH